MVGAQHPGQVLHESFMEPRKLSQNALARAIEVPPRRINEIILGKRRITADTDLRLCKDSRARARVLAPDANDVGPRGSP